MIVQQEIRNGYIDHKNRGERPQSEGMFQGAMYRKDEAWYEWIDFVQKATFAT